MNTLRILIYGSLNDSEIQVDEHSKIFNLWSSKRLLNSSWWTLWFLIYDSLNDCEIQVDEHSKIFNLWFSKRLLDESW